MVILSDTQLYSDFTYVFFLFSDVLLRACWMHAAEKCFEDGDATFCTCKSDLCNSAPSPHERGRLKTTALLLISTAFLLLFTTNRLILSADICPNRLISPTANENNDSTISSINNSLSNSQSVSKNKHQRTNWLVWQRRLSPVTSANLNE